MSFWISSTSISFAINWCTRRRRSTGSISSSTSCALSTLRSRFDATKSESRPGSSRFVAMATRSGEMFLPRVTIFSSDALYIPDNRLEFGRIRNHLRFRSRRDLSP